MESPLSEINYLPKMGLQEGRKEGVIRASLDEDGGKGNRNGRVCSMVVQVVAMAQVMWESGSYL